MMKNVIKKNQKEEHNIMYINEKGEVFEAIKEKSININVIILPHKMLNITNTNTHKKNL